VINIFPIDKIILKESNTIDFLEKMDKNDVFVKFVEFVDVDDKNIFYFLDTGLCTILKLDSDTGKLIKFISSRGQGSGELDIPIAMKVTNNMIFVADFGFGGVKIFSTEGDLLKEFKTGLHIGWLDVNKRNEIFVREAETDSMPVISIYNMDGKKIRKFLRFPIKNRSDRIAFILNREFIFRLDSKENIIVLFHKKNIIRKYNKKGDMLWERKIENEILQKHSNPRKPRLGKGSSVYIRSNVFQLDIDKNNNIIVGHVAGGMVFNPDGKAVKLLVCEPPVNLDVFKLYNNDKKILRLGVGGRYKIKIYEYKKGGN
jgi:DNA-binding beta-propeller fold protein YncE